MNNRWFHIALFVSWLAGLSSCVEEYKPDIIEAPNNYLVVEGTLLDNDTTVIRLSRTSGLDSLGTKPVNNASIVVESSGGGSLLTLAELGDGIYKAFSDLDASRNYRLKITTSGKIYYSEYVPVKDAPEVGNVGWDVVSGNNIQVHVSSSDPQNNTIYYRWDFMETWEYRSAYNSVYKFEDDVVQVRDIPEELIHICYRTKGSTDIYAASSTQLNEDVISKYPLQLIRLAGDDRLDRRYSILVRQYALTREAFEFWDILKKNTENLGTLFDPQPSQLPSNFYCETNPDEPVIGYFSAGRVTQKRLFIDRSDIPFSFNYNRFPVCALDTVSIDSTLSYDLFNNSPYIPVDTYGVFEPTDYLYSDRSCVDCRLGGGTLEKPDFW
ncbi:MAG: DUF4249 domain-containing protein [Owenweeksia sp.]